MQKKTVTIPSLSLLVAQDLDWSGNAQRTNNTEDGAQESMIARVPEVCGPKNLFASSADTETHQQIEV